MHNKFLGQNLHPGAKNLGVLSFWKKNEMATKNLELLGLWIIYKNGSYYASHKNP